MNFNIKSSSKIKDVYYKENNISLDFASSPIKNCKKVIKRNTRTNSYNSFFCNKTEAISTCKNNYIPRIISPDFNTKINLKKNIFAFSNKAINLNLNKNIIKKETIKKNRSKENIKNITAHESTSNLSKFNTNSKNLNNIYNNKYDSNSNNINLSTNFIINKKKRNKRNRLDNSNLINSNEFNYIKDNFFLNENNNKETKEKIFYRNNNTLILNKNNNINNKNFNDKNKTLICKNKKQPELLDSIFNTNKICNDLDIRDGNSTKSIKSKSKSKGKHKKNRILNLNFKNFCNKTTKNSNKKKRNNLNNIELNSYNKLDFSTEKGSTPNINTNNTNTNEFLPEFELLYNCLKKKSESNHKLCSGHKLKDKKKNITLNKKNKKYNFLLDKNIINNDSLLGIIYENKQIKKRNEELSKQFENIKKEFEIMKKDNKDIKEELKEKTKYLKDIKLTMDIFSQELLKLQNIAKEEINNNNTSLIINNNNSKEKPKIIFDANTKKINNEINNNINNKSTNSNNNVNNNSDNKKIKNINTKNINNMIMNKDSKKPQINTESNQQKSSKIEKIHQLCLSNINKLISPQHKERGSSFDPNNFQDTSKLINIETKDTTEKENECFNDKWPSPLILEKKENKNKEEININESMEENSVDLSNISLADNLNINKEMYNLALNKSKKKQKFDLKVKYCKKNDIDKDEEKIIKMPKKLNFIKNDNFNEEFMKYYDIFSDSWRKEVDKMLKKGKR